MNFDKRVVTILPVANMAKSGSLPERCSDGSVPRAPAVFAGLRKGFGHLYRAESTKGARSKSLLLTASISICSGYFFQENRPGAILFAVTAMSSVSTRAADPPSAKAAITTISQFAKMAGVLFLRSSASARRLVHRLPIGRP